MGFVQRDVLLFQQRAKGLPNRGATVFFNPHIFGPFVSISNEEKQTFFAKQITANKCHKL
jgi:hypothetical protein